MKKRARHEDVRQEMVFAAPCSHSDLRHNTADAEQAKRLARLGKHKMGKSCLYFKRLADLDAEVLEALIAESVAGLKRRYPSPSVSA